MRTAKQATRMRTSSIDVSDHLVEAALAILEESGLTTLTVRAVATRAGVAPMGVYSRFGSKDGLLEALFISGFQGLRDAIEPPSATSPRRFLESGCMGYRRFAIEHPQLYHLMFEQMMALDLSCEALDVARSTFSVLADRVQAAMDRGELASGDNIEVAQQIWSAMHGAVSLEIAGVHFAQDRELNFETMIDALLNGLARPR